MGRVQDRHSAFNYTFWHYAMPRLMQNIDRNTQKQGYEFLSHKNQ